MQEVGGWTARGAVWLMEMEHKKEDGRCKEKELTDEAQKQEPQRVRAESETPNAFPQNVPASYFYLF